MTETDTKRTALVGVGPHSRTLKFLNNKNNIANTLLSKKMELIQRQNAITLNHLEHKKLDTQDFLKKIKFLEGDTNEVKALIKKGENKDEENNQESTLKPRRQRKPRLARTAPANSNGQNPNQQSASALRKLVKSGPETSQEREQMLKPDRRKSMYIQLPGKGKDHATKENTRPPLPKPNPKTLLDVMIGLNAFSHVPPPGSRVCGDVYEDIRAESRESTLGRNSIYGSSENIAQNFISKWRKNVASRKESICLKLESFDNQITENALHRSMSVAFSSVPEDYESDDNFVRRKHSKWHRRQSKMITPTLPAIHDDGERQEIFLAWVKEDKERLKDVECPVYKNPEVEKQTKRRNSFVAWLKNRGDKMEPRAYSPDRDGNALGGSRLRHILEEDDDDDAPDAGDLMRTILKLKTKFRDPLESRVRKFNEEIEKIKERDAAVRNKPSTKEQRRKWLMLTKGIDAALAESSDEDDDFYW